MIVPIDLARRPRSGTLEQGGVFGSRSIGAELGICMATLFMKAALLIVTKSRDPYQVL